MIYPLCPTCGQLWPTSKGKRLCSLCLNPLRKHHRWFTGLDGRPQHYHCDDPTHGPGPTPPAESTIFAAASEEDKS